MNPVFYAYYQLLSPKALLYELNPRENSLLKLLTSIKILQAMLGSMNNVVDIAIDRHFLFFNPVTNLGFFI